MKLAGMDGSYQKKRSVEAETMVWSRMSQTLRVVVDPSPELKKRRRASVDHGLVNLAHNKSPKILQEMRKTKAKKMGGI